MPFHALKFFLPVSFALLALSIPASRDAANAQPPGTQAKTLPAHQSPPVKQGLNFSVGNRGLTSLWFNGQSLLRSNREGELQPWKSAFRAALDVLFPPASSSISPPTKRADTVDLSYPWGRVSCTYDKQGNKITMQIEVSNASAKEIDQLSLRLLELNFPSAPNGGTLEAGMFGFGFKGPEWPLHHGPESIPSIADSEFVVPIVRLDYGTGAVNFCSDDLESSVDVPYSANSVG